MGLTPVSACLNQGQTAKGLRSLFMDFRSFLLLFLFSLMAGFQVIKVVSLTSGHCDLSWDTLA